MQPGVTKPFFIFVHRFLGKFPKRIESPFDRDTPQVFGCKTRRRPRAQTRTRLPPCAFLRLSARSCTIRNKSFLDAELPRTNEKAGHATHLPTDEAPHRAEGRYRSDGKTASGQRTTQARSLAYPSQQEPRSRSSRGSMFNSIDGRLSVTQTRIAVRSQNTRPAITCARSTSGPR